MFLIFSHGRLRENTESYLEIDNASFNLNDKNKSGLIVEFRVQVDLFIISFWICEKVVCFLLEINYVFFNQKQLIRS